MTVLLWLMWIAQGRADRALYLRWVDRQEVVPHEEPLYLFHAEVHDRLRPQVTARPGVVEPFVAGHTVKGRPVWAFRVHDPMTPTTHKMLVFAGLHALEWLGVEAAVRFLEDVIEHPPPHVEITVIPIVNVDRRLQVEADLLRGERIYRRSNANGVDLNRDFAVHRDTQAIWRHIIPNRYSRSDAPLSQPESQLIDRLADAERFDTAVSLHAWGGYIYYPWAGHFSRPPDHAALLAEGLAMQHAQGHHPYRVQQLSHWGFFFRALGSEIDHLYGQYGTHAFLIELGRSGIHPLKPETWRDPFRMYNPVDPTEHAEQGARALHALAWYPVLR